MRSTLILAAVAALVSSPVMSQSASPSVPNAAP